MQATTATPARTSATNFLTAGVTLQSTLSSASAGMEEQPVTPHHPITCVLGELRYEDDGSFSCGHAAVEPDDRRTQACIVHSIALLVVELAAEL